jgi:diguanylate cyclase (GGDEF)-like protein/PAS domain S-box-containing protein
MNLFNGKNLHHKLLIYIFVAAFFFTSIATFISFHIEMNHANQKAEVVISQLIDAIEPTASIAVYSNNVQIAEDVLNGLLRNNVVHKAIITSDQGLSLEKTKGTQTENQQEIIRELFSPFGTKKSIGQVSVTSNASFILNEAQDAAQTNAIQFFILVGLTLLFMLLVVHSLFSRPLIRISNTLRDILAGEQESIEPLEDNKNDELGSLVININKILALLTTKLSTQQVLRKRVEFAEKKLRNIFESTSAGLFLLDKDGKILTCTPTLLKILGYEDNNLIAINGQVFATLFFKEPMQFQQMMQNALEMEQLEAQDLMLHNNTEEHPLWVHCLVSKIVDAFGITRFEGVVFDISKRVASEKAMHYEANHDGLTGLLRRNAAELQLRKHLSSAKSASTIVLLLDLDGFKAANDTYGHDVGDIVLIQSARRLESCVRHNDIVCRLGGDEFLIILFNCDPISTGFSIAEEIIVAIKKPVVINADITVNIGVSIGIALFPMHGNSVESLIKSADEAMYEVKRKGKNGYGIKNKNGIISVNRPSEHKYAESVRR